MRGKYLISKTNKTISSNAPGEVGGSYYIQGIIASEVVLDCRGKIAYSTSRKSK